jgi:hypothetical protein
MLAWHAKGPEFHTKNIFKKEKKNSMSGWCRTAIPELRKQRQED